MSSKKRSFGFLNICDDAGAGADADGDGGEVQAPPPPRRSTRTRSASTSTSSTPSTKTSSTTKSTKTKTTKKAKTVPQKVSIKKDEEESHTSDDEAPLHVSTVPAAVTTAEVITVSDADADAEDTTATTAPAADTHSSEIEERVFLMNMKEVKAELKKRDLSVKGTRKVLDARLSARLLKEVDPAYKPKNRHRMCKWCGDYMKMRRGYKGEFYGCRAFPKCQYTTSLSGTANKNREHLKGVPASGIPGPYWRGWERDRD